MERRNLVRMQACEKSEVVAPVTKTNFAVTWRHPDRPRNKVIVKVLPVWDAYVCLRQFSFAGEAVLGLLKAHAQRGGQPRRATDADQDRLRFPGVGWRECLGQDLFLLDGIAPTETTL